jgi:hypothetical protein
MVVRPKLYYWQNEKKEAAVQREEINVRSITFVWDDIFHFFIYHFYM